MNAFRPLVTTIFIAACAFSTWARAENIYQCGSTYSQTPCAEGRVLNIEDTRDAAQKKQTDNAIRRDAKLAKELAANRLAQERAARADNVPIRSAAKSDHGTPVADPEPPLPRITPKRLRSKAHQPSDFVALVPGSDNPPAKTKKKKKSQIRP